MSADTIYISIGAGFWGLMFIYSVIVGGKR